MKSQDQFNSCFALVRADANYVPRKHRTIGGMWTVDTWQIEDVKVQLADEGYTRIIRTENLNVRANYKNELTFDKGTEEDLEILYNKLAKKEG